MPFDTSPANLSVSENSPAKSSVWQRLLLGLVVLALLAAAGLAVLNERRMGRDTRRIADITQIMAGLTLYHDDHNAFPSSLKFGEPLVAGDGTVYVTSLPQNPVPGGIPYEYQAGEKESTYALKFSLEGQLGDYAPGEHVASPRGIK